MDERKLNKLGLWVAGLLGILLAFMALISWIARS